jgi:hypothetical protein
MTIFLEFHPVSIPSPPREMRLSRSRGSRDGKSHGISHPVLEALKNGTGNETTLSNTDSYAYVWNKLVS